MSSDTTKHDDQEQPTGLSEATIEAAEDLDVDADEGSDVTGGAQAHGIWIHSG